MHIETHYRPINSKDTSLYIEEKATNTRENKSLNIYKPDVSSIHYIFLEAP
jgi:hypothetical protein